MSERILIIKHVEIEGPGSIESFFQNTKWTLATLDFAAGGFPPDDFSDIRAIISLGGPMNVYEEADYPFLRYENLFLKKNGRTLSPLFYMARSCLCVNLSSGKFHPGHDLAGAGFSL